MLYEKHKCWHLVVACSLHSSATWLRRCLPWFGRPVSHTKGVSLVVDCSLCCASLQPQCPVEPSGFATLRQGTWLLLRQPQRTASATSPSVRSRRFPEASRNDVWPRWHRWRKHLQVGRHRPALGCGATPWTICPLSNRHLTAFLKAGEL